MRKLLNRETVLYIVFGAATTLVNYAVFFALYRGSGVVANAAAFAVAVIFAFAVNKLFVFESRSWSLATLKKEIPGFLAGRVGSFIIEEAGLFLCENVLRLGGVTAVAWMGYTLDWVEVAKLALSVIVVVLNYAFCKWFVFKK